MDNHNNTGILGEDIAERFLVKRGFSIKSRNFTKKWGEIDIVAEKGGVTHFVEVKSVTREKDGASAHYPEERIDERKQERLRRVIQSYILKKKIHTWQVDVIAVFINASDKTATVRVTEDVVLG